MNAECKDVTNAQDQVDAAAPDALTEEQLAAVSGGRHHHHRRAYYGAPGYAAYSPAAYPVVAARYRRRYY